MYAVEILHTLACVLAVRLAILTFPIAFFNRAVLFLVLCPNCSFSAYVSSSRIEFVGAHSCVKEAGW